MFERKGKLYIFPLQTTKDFKYEDLLSASYDVNAGYQGLYRLDFGYTGEKMATRLIYNKYNKRFVVQQLTKTNPAGVICQRKRGISQDDNPGFYVD